MFDFNLSEIIILAAVIAFPFVLHKGIRLQIAHNVKKDIINNGGKGVPCPYCAEMVLPSVEKCPFCRSDLKPLV